MSCVVKIELPRQVSVVKTDVCAMYGGEEKVGVMGWIGSIKC